MAYDFSDWEFGEIPGLDKFLRKNMAAAFKQFSEGRWHWDYKLKSLAWTSNKFDGDDPAVIEIDAASFVKAGIDVLLSSFANERPLLGSEARELKRFCQVLNDWRAAIDEVEAEANRLLSKR